MDVFRRVGIPSNDKTGEVSKSLVWPATKDEIVEQAKRKGLPREVVERLEKLPDKTYKNIGEVIAQAGRD
ncbi:MAG: DUF2795 domain-containing protein [Armatimonadota bacterium]|nr:DUF2795 domain-containing protein [Armatimonadota bacterium]